MSVVDHVDTNTCVQTFLISRSDQVTNLRKPTRTELSTGGYHVSFRNILGMIKENGSILSFIDFYF